MLRSVQAVVRDVEAGGAAEQLGVRLGDEIAAVAGCGPGSGLPSTTVKVCLFSLASCRVLPCYRPTRLPWLRWLEFLLLPCACVFARLIVREAKSPLTDKRQKP